MPYLAPEEFRCVECEVGELKVVKRDEETVFTVCKGCGRCDNYPLNEINGDILLALEVNELDL